MNLSPFVANIVFDAFNTSSLANKGVVLILIALSLYTWMTLIGKSGDLKIIDRKNLKLIRQFHGRAHPAQLFIEAQGKFAPGIPVAHIYTSVMTELMSIMRRKGVVESDISAWQPGLTNFPLSETEMASIRAIADGQVSEQILVLESRMSTLATCSNTAPSIGLLGTVWGVMESFMAMANSGSGMMINSVAPGIAGALLTTVIGLVIAIPSIWGYNRLCDHVKATTVKVENFADELVADIARAHLFTKGVV